MYMKVLSRDVKFKVCVVYPDEYSASDWVDFILEELVRTDDC